MYETISKQREPGKVPLNSWCGRWVCGQGGRSNKVIELPGIEPGSFAVLFGTQGKRERGCISAHNGTAKGRRFPAFAHRTKRSAGFKLQVRTPRNQSSCSGIRPSKPLSPSPGVRQWLNLQICSVDGPGKGNARSKAGLARRGRGAGPPGRFVRGKRGADPWRGPGLRQPLRGIPSN